MQTGVARAVKPAWHTAGAPFPQKQRSPLPAGRPGAKEMITLRLGDFLDRIPADMLDPGTHDRMIPMPFDLFALSERIGRGDTTIRLAEIFRLMPDVFRANAVIRHDRVISFPWEKVLTMIREAYSGGSDAGISRAGVEMLVRKFKARKSRNPATGAPAAGASGYSSTTLPSTVAEISEACAPAGSLGAVAQTVAPMTPPTLALPSAAFESPDVAALKAERDAALARAAKISGVYDSMIARIGHLTNERDEARAGVAELTAERGAASARTAEPVVDREAASALMAELAAERDAAVARAAKLVADSDAAVALVTEITDERDAAKAQLAALVIERDAAVARTVELNAERDAAVAETAKAVADSQVAAALAAEFDRECEAAKARAVALTGERDAAAAQVEALTGERAAAKAQVAALTGERDAAKAQVMALTGERDAAAACMAEILKAPDSAARAASESPVTTDSSAAVEECISSIEALTCDGHAVRPEQQQPAESVSAPDAGGRKKAKQRARHDESQPDAYSSLFPQRAWMQRGAAALLLGLLGIGVASRTDFGMNLGAGAESSGTESPVPTAAPATPTLTSASIAEGDFTLETTATGEAATLLLPEPPVGEPSEPLPGNPNRVEWKPIPSRRGR